MDTPTSASQGSRQRFDQHPLRAAVLGEVHARPFRLVAAPRVFLHYAFETRRDRPNSDRGHFDELCRLQGVSIPGETVRHHVIPFGTGSLKWERHAEFTTYTWDAPLTGHTGPFGELPSTHPFGASFVAPGPLLVAARLELLATDGDLDAAAGLFDAASLCVCEVISGRAIAITDFRQDGDGRSRILVLDRGLSAREAGPLAQRLLEIETYRTFSLLGLPEAERVGPDIRRIEQALIEITSSIRSTEGLDANRRLLAELSRLSADLEAGSAESSYRFGASAAYDEIVKNRLGAIGEIPVAGFGPWSTFLDRRMGPAIRTIEVTVIRQRDLSAKLARTAELLRTRVDIDVEQQNRDLLHSMNQRARQQLQLQQTVEGLSVAAISYYVVGLIGHLFEAVKEGFHLAFDAHIATGFSVPVVVVLIYLIVRQIRAAHSREERD